jgi:hypothetical protein
VPSHAVRGSSPAWSAAGLAPSVLRGSLCVREVEIEVRGVLRGAGPLLAGLVSAIALAVFSKPSVALASHPTVDHLDAPSRDLPTVCHGQADNPHYSDGSGGIIFKMRASCSVTTNIASVSGRLWRCAKPPSGDEGSWTDQGCTLAASHNYSIKRFRGERPEHGMSPLRGNLVCTERGTGSE